MIQAKSNLVDLEQVINGGINSEGIIEGMI